jgi:hypothetical protein
MNTLTANAILQPGNGQRDTKLCEELFAVLQAATSDGIGITCESFGSRESLALDIIEKSAKQFGLTTERDAGANTGEHRTFGASPPATPRACKFRAEPATMPRSLPMLVFQAR